MPPGASAERPVVFVTGASSGIGAACVKVFAAAGWNVAAAARRKDRLESLARDVRATNADAAIEPLACDVDDDASVREAFGGLRSTFGRLDALVNNAGFGVYGTVDDVPLERFRANMETNYFGVLRCTKEALPLLKESAHAGRGPAIVMVSSFVGGRAMPGMAAYAASKFALEGLSESLRIELAGEGISVSVVNPGVTKTEFFESSQGKRPDAFLKPEAGMTPETVACVILRAVRRPRRNVWLTLPGKAGIFVNWLSPRLLDWTMKRVWKKPKT